MNLNVAGAFLLACVFALQVHADVKIYNLNLPTGTAPTISSTTLIGDANNLQASISELTRLLKSTDALEQNSTLVAKSVVKNAYGFTQKFIIKYKNVPVEGNSLIATFDNAGVLQSVTHDLPKAELALVDGAVSKEEALEKAKDELETVFGKLNVAVPSAIRNAELAVIKDKTGVATLVWRMKIGSYLIDIGAGDRLSGQIVDVNSLNQNTDTEGLLSKVSEVSINSYLNGEYNGILFYRNSELTNEGKIYSFINSDLVRKQMSESLKIFRNVLDIYQSDFHLDSFDGNGQKVKVAFAQDMTNNAFWNGKIFVLPTNSDKTPDMNGLGQAADVLGHEFTHAVIQYSSDLLYMGQSGALNESLADSFGEYSQMRMGLVRQPWKLGEDVKSGNALRDMKNPSLGWQPAHMDDLYNMFFIQYKSCTRGLGKDNCGVHVLSGIPNRAFALIVEAIGWESTMPIYYRTMTLRLHPTSDFKHFRNSIMDECALQLSPEKCKLVEEAFRLVGL